MKRLAILGASGHGQVVADAALSGGWSDVVFFDDHRTEAFPGTPVTGATADLLETAATFEAVVVAIGDNATRERLQGELESVGARMAVVVHPSAVVSERSEIAPGTVILPNAVINTGAVVGPGCIINTSAIVEHHCVLGNAVHVSPGARLAGGVTVGSRAWLGLGCSVLQQLAIGTDAVVGAGAVVTRAVPPGITVIGVPARKV